MLPEALAMRQLVDLAQRAEGAIEGAADFLMRGNIASAGETASKLLPGIRRRARKILAG